ncbi:MAG: TonB-dependent receptor [Marinilabiliaceae bacterium]|nr:TonB-dependent receptor [Marinilabiliaceae bacterium]
MEKNRAVLLLIILLIISNMGYGENNPGAVRKNAVISGYIKDQLTGEALIGATVFINELKTGAVTNLYGFYSLSVVPGNYRLTYTYLGFESVEKELNINSDITTNVRLTPNAEEINEVTVVSKKPDANVTDTQMGVEKLQSKTIKSVPVLLGEVDPIKVIQMLPGVKATSEGSSGFSVRGGSPDQNLVLLDEATVYNAGHLMGFFSVFNNDALKDVNLYKGDIPANYGGRLASVLDVRMKEGNNQQFSGNGGIGLISSRLTLEGPVFNEKTSFVLSGRRSYADLFLPLASDTAIRKAQLYFYDLNAKINHTINENNRIYLSGYFGRDVMKQTTNEFNYGNQTVTARWNHVFTPRLFSNFTFILSNYDYKIGAEDNGGSGFLWESQLTDYGVKLDFDYFLNTKNTISFGGQVLYHRIDPGFARGVGEDSYISKIQMPYARSFESSVYVSNDQKITPVLSVRYGLRFSSFSNVGEATYYQYDNNYEKVGHEEYDNLDFYNTYNNIEPRVAMTFMLNPKSSVKASYSRTVQYIQLASNSTTGSPLDVWFPASPNIKPQISDQGAVGYFRNFDNNTIETSVELFYKDMRNVIDFKDHANLLLNRYLEGEMRTGTGHAYGAEFLVRVTKPKYSGWVSYTYSRAYRKIDEVFDGKTYNSPYDRPHDFSIVLNRKVGKRGSFSINWVYTSGTPYTAPSHRMELGKVHYISQGNYYTNVPVYNGRNKDRFPAYHRMDIGYTLQSKNVKNRRWQGEWNFSVYNVYGRHNPWMVSFGSEEGNSVVNKGTLVYLFSVIPSVTYNFKF